MKLKIICIVQARTNSSRLSGKILLGLGKKTVLQYLIERLKKSKKIHNLIVATTNSKLDNKICKISKINNIKVEIDKKRLRPIDADLQVPNTNKFHKHTGWKPEISFEKTMQDLLEYWRQKVKKNPNQLLR